MKMILFNAFVILVGYVGQVVIADPDLSQIFDEGVKEINKLKQLPGDIDQPIEMDDSSALESNTEIMKKELEKVYENKNPEKLKEMTGLIEQVKNGLTEIKTGFNSQKWLKVVNVGLSLLSFLAKNTGDAGIFFKAIHSALTAGLSFFGIKEKSQSALILEGFHQALLQQKLDDRAKNTLVYLQGIAKTSETIEIKLKAGSGLTIKEIKEVVANSINDPNSVGILAGLQLEIERDCKTSNCAQCLYQIQEYLALSVRKQLFILQIIGLYESVSKNSLQTDILLPEVKLRLKIDEQMIDYLLKPKKRHSLSCAVHYYSFPGEYPFVDNYLKWFLENLNDDKDNQWHFVFADNDNLKGPVTPLYLKDIPSDKYETYAWLKNIKSLFIPPKHEVSLTAKAKGEVYLFKGPTVVNLKHQAYTEMSITYKKELNGEYIRGCSEHFMAGPCIQVDPKGTEMDIARHFNPKSLYIPPGISLTIEAKYKDITGLYEGIHGPLTMGYICKRGTEILSLQKNELVNQENEIKICTKQYFRGWCDYIDKNVVETNKIHSCVWKKIKSYYIPESMRLIVEPKKSLRSKLLKLKKEDISGEKAEEKATGLENIALITVDII